MESPRSVLCLRCVRCDGPMYESHSDWCIECLEYGYDTQEESDSDSL
jgi:hypothetical protein